MKVHAITMGYAPARIIGAGLERFYETKNPACSLTHYVVDHLYPLQHEEVQKTIEAARIRHEFTVLTPEANMGLHGGLNWACELIKPAPGDIVIIYDPDSYPIDFGWDQALVVAVANGGLAIAGLVHDDIANELKTRSKLSRVVDGYLEVTEIATPCMISVSAWSWDFVKAAGGFQEPCAYYGGLEGAMWAHLHGKPWGYTTQYREDTRLRALQDVELRNWKWRHAHLGDWPGTFESYIEAGAPWTEPAVGPR